MKATSIFTICEEMERERGGEREIIRELALGGGGGGR